MNNILCETSTVSSLGPTPAVADERAEVNAILISGASKLLPSSLKHEEEMEKLRQRIDAQSKILDDMEVDCEEAKAFHNLSTKELMAIR